MVYTSRMGGRDGVVAGVGAAAGGNKGEWYAGIKGFTTVAGTGGGCAYAGCAYAGCE